MAKGRYVNTHFWNDSFVIELDPIEKLLFLYLLTNDQTEIAGAYEIAIRTIALDTGIDKEMVLKILTRFEAAKKITYREGWILIHNFIKNQSVNPSVMSGMVRSLNCCPDWIRDRLLQAGDRLPQAVVLNLTKPNLTKPNGVCEIPEDEQLHLTDCLEKLRNAFGVVLLPDERGWSECIEWAWRNSFSAEQLVGCFEWLSNQEWRDSAVKPRHVIDNLAKYVKEVDGPKIKNKWHHTI